jgi:hypothetical protein
MTATFETVPLASGWVIDHPTRAGVLCTVLRGWVAEDETVRFRVMFTDPNTGGTVYEEVTDPS